jgi:DNA-binding beta-propeller fold protein YncE
MKKRKARSSIMAATGAWLAIAVAVSCSVPSQAQVNPPKFEVDPSWPKPLPDHWVTGSVSGVCVDAQDHVFIVNRQNLKFNELDAGYQAPPVIEFDPEGSVVNSWGDPNVLGKGVDGCFVDRENNVWLSFNKDAVVQKFGHNGGKLLLQIGTRGVFDSSDGTIKGIALNSSPTSFFCPAGVAVDASNGDVYVADGEETGRNHRVAVFDRNGRFLRQWGLQRTKAEADDDEGDVFMQVPHCVAMGDDGLVYVCDLRADRVQVFDKMGSFQKNIHIPYEGTSQYHPRPGHLHRAWGTAVWVGFSPDPAQTFMYVMNEDDEQVEIVDHANGEILGSFGRAGHQVGELTHGRELAVDSKGNVYVAESEIGKRIQKFEIMGSQ